MIIPKKVSLFNNARKFKRIGELRERLGWVGGLAHGMGGRPKGMHRKTYDRLVWEYCNVAEQVLADTMKFINKGKQ